MISIVYELSSMTIEKVIRNVQRTTDTDVIGTGEEMRGINPQVLGHVLVESCDQQPGEVIDPTYLEVPAASPEISHMTGVYKDLALMQQAVEVDLTQAEREHAIWKRIESGEITAETFGSLTAEEQGLVQLVLFKQYAPTRETTAKALSGIEFALIVLFKLLGKALDRSKLTASELDYFESILEVINLNDMPINDKNDWRFNYFAQEYTETQENRKAYQAEKEATIGVW